VSTRKEPAILDHEYDGIREYDNPTPGWWHAIFISSILFAFFYITFWHFSPLAWSVQESWEKDQVADYKRLFGAVGDLKPDESTILSMMVDQKMMGVAQSIFVGNCAVCHGKEASGINGVNLTDDYYKNVKKIEDIFTTITKGANLGAMPSWEQKLSKNERVIVAAYVATLRGKNIPGRAPEGEKIPPWPPVPAASAVTAPAKAPSP
jgi:cytochrome c oxidase cbb3-type subunit 3